MALYPLDFAWDGEVMVPKNAYRADRQYVVGDTYRLIPHEERSGNSHNHYFAALRDAWANLPDNTAARFPTADHLRRWALIKAGYRDERTIVLDTKAKAVEVAAFIKPVDDYAVVIARDHVVAILTAKSQSMKAMGKKDFQASKQAVLEIVAGMIGTDAEALQANARAAA